MMEAISTQSKNEVQELLNEYVVTPLNTDISKTLTKMERSVEDLEESTKAEIRRVSSSVGENIVRLKSKEEAAFEEIEQTVKDSKGDIIEAVSTLLQNSTIQLQSDIADVQSRIGNELTQSLDSQSEQLSSLLTSSVENLNKTVNDNHISTTEGLHQTEEILKSQYDKVKNQSEALNLMVSTEFATSNSKIDQFHDEIDMAIDNSKAEMQAVIEKKYKTLFIISLSLGITNFLGIIAMILLYLIK